MAALRCTRLGDAAYEALAKHCPEIEVLRLYATMPSAHAIQGFHLLSKLRIIDICGAHEASGGFYATRAVLFGAVMAPS